MKTQSKHRTCEYYFDQIGKELKKWEEQTKKKNADKPTPKYQ